MSNYKRTKIVKLDKIETLYQSQNIDNEQYAGGNVTVT